MVKFSDLQIYDSSYSENMGEIGVNVYFGQGKINRKEMFDLVLFNRKRNEKKMNVMSGYLVFTVKFLPGIYKFPISPADKSKILKGSTQETFNKEQKKYFENQQQKCDQNPYCNNIHCHHSIVNFHFTTLVNKFLNISTP